jgi:hypothetical protein
VSVRISSQRIRPYVAGMKVLLQNTSTRLFYGTDGWIANAEKATSFTNSVTALNFLQTHSFGEVQIVLKFKNPVDDIILPISRLVNNQR